MRSIRKRIAENRDFWSELGEAYELTTDKQYICKKSIRYTQTRGENKINDFGSENSHCQLYHRASQILCVCCHPYL